MGTRAVFFVGHPANVESREWLGTIAWDGYPEGSIGDWLVGVTSEAEFRAGVKKIEDDREDFANPAVHSFPFPWMDDLYLTDYTYAWFGGKVWMTCFHIGLVSLDEFMAGDDEARAAYYESADTLPTNIPAPAGGGTPGPDSIIIIQAR